MIMGHQLMRRHHLWSVVICGDDVVIKTFYVHRLAPHKLYLIVERFPERFPRSRRRERWRMIMEFTARVLQLECFLIHSVSYNYHCLTCHSHLLKTAPKPVELENAPSESEVILVRNSVTIEFISVCIPF